MNLILAKPLTFSVSLCAKGPQCTCQNSGLLALCENVCGTGTTYSTVGRHFKFIILSMEKEEHKYSIIIGADLDKHSKERFSTRKQKNGYYLRTIWHPNKALWANCHFKKIVCSQERIYSNNSCSSPIHHYHG